MRVLIIGCGYIGMPLGEELVRLGHEVHGMRRTAIADQILKDAGIIPVMADVSRLEDLQKLPGGYDWVVNTVSSSKGGVEEYRQVYLDGTRNVIEWLAPAPPKKYVYTSSTSVYGQTDGSIIKENSPTQPATETGTILVETEKLLLDAQRAKNFPAIILRVAGIYGPDRGHLFHQYLRNEAKIPARGERLINMIHRHDVVGAIVAALKSGRAGEIYNVVDNEPVPMIHFYRWLSETLGKDMPPFVGESEQLERKRGATHKKVSNRKLTMEMGYQPKYPTFRQGYTAEIQRLQDAGKL